MDNRVREYKQESWVALLNRTFNEITKLGIEKGGEYSGDKDRLANFRRNAARLGLLKEQVWAVYAGKHWDAIDQHIKDLASGTLRVKSEPIEGRAHDLLVYLLLFLAMEEERRLELAPRKPDAIDDTAGEIASFLYPPQK